MKMTVVDVARQIGATLRGDQSLQIEGVATLEAAGPEHVSFLANRRYASLVTTSRAGAIILSESDARHAGDRTVLIAPDPYFAFREAMVLLHGFRRHPDGGVSPEARVHPTAQVGEGCSIHAGVVIGPGAKVGDGVTLYPNVYIGEGAQVGDETVLYPNVTIYDRCILGRRVTLHAGCVIGQDGFGYATHARAGEPPMHHKIPQAGIAIVEDDVEMGANCSVDRATLGATVIGRGTKFSNSVTIGHGTKVGPHNLFVAQVGVAGSVETGAYVVMGGQVGVAGHLKVGDQVRVAGRSGVISDVPPKTQVGGMPALPFLEMKRIYIQSQRLPEMAATIKRLQRRLDELEARLEEAESGGGTD